jgi:hypothetical protein
MTRIPPLDLCDVRSGNRESREGVGPDHEGVAVNTLGNADCRVRTALARVSDSDPVAGRKWSKTQRHIGRSRRSTGREKHREEESDPSSVWGASSRMTSRVEQSYIQS